MAAGRISHCHMRRNNGKNTPTPAPDPIAVMAKGLEFTCQKSSMEKRTANLAASRKTPLRKTGAFGAPLQMVFPKNLMESTSEKAMNKNGPGGLANTIARTGTFLFAVAKTGPTARRIYDIKLTII